MSRVSCAPPYLATAITLQNELYSILNNTQGMAGAAALFQLVEDPCVADAADKSYQPVELEISHC